MKKFQLFFAFVLLSFVFISCGDDVDCTEAVLEAAAEPLTDAWFDASVDFGLDASEENCKTFKSASEDYLDFLNDHKECAEAQILCVHMRAKPLYAHFVQLLR